MIVEIPFITRFTGHTPNKSDIREIASYDRHTMAIPDLSPSEFDEGSYLGGGVGTLMKEGEHWAYWGTSEAGFLQNRPIDAMARDRAMGTLSRMIDTTRFLDGGRVKLAVNRMMSTPPDQKYIVSWERDRNVQRLSDWIVENVAMIGPHLAVKVGEPSMRLSASEPDDKGRVILHVTRERLIPILGNYGPGLHVPVAQRDVLIDLARESVASNPLTDSMLVIMEAAELARITTNFDPVEDMYERSLRSIAADVTARGPLGKNRSAARPHFERLEALVDLLPGEAAAEDLDAVMDDLSAVSRNVRRTSAVLIDLVASRWEDRPVRFHGIDIGQRGVPRP